MLDKGKPKKLPAVRRKEINLSSDSWVCFEPLVPGTSGARERGLPVVARPALAGVDVVEWTRRHLPLLLGQLHAHGAVLLRGFEITSAAAFERLGAVVAGEALPYTERSSPRSQVSGNVYTSTDHPPAERIFLHNEQSYNLTFPLRLFFACLTPAAEGGATPLADTRRVYQRIPHAIRARFIEQGYLYVRNFDARFGVPWQVAFQTESRSEVEAYCRKNEIEFEWWGGDGLRTRQVRRAAGRHPFTGEPVWFNHATFFHVSTLPRALGASLLAELGEEALPNNTYYGDGAPIEPEVLELLRAAYLEEMIEFPWQRGDVLLIDNMLSAHGRASFAGPRQVLASMATPFPWSAVPTVDAAAGFQEPAAMAESPRS